MLSKWQNMNFPLKLKIFTEQPIFSDTNFAFCVVAGCCCFIRIFHRSAQRLFWQNHCSNCECLMQILCLSLSLSLVPYSFINEFQFQMASCVRQNACYEKRTVSFIYHLTYIIYLCRELSSMKILSTIRNIILEHGMTHSSVFSSHILFIGCYCCCSAFSLYFA